MQQTNKVSHVVNQLLTLYPVVCILPRAQELSIPAFRQNDLRFLH